MGGSTYSKWLFPGILKLTWFLIFRNLLLPSHCSCILMENWRTYFFIVMVHSWAWLSVKGYRQWKGKIYLATFVGRHCAAILGRQNKKTLRISDWHTYLRYLSGTKIRLVFDRKHESLNDENSLTFALFAINRPFWYIIIQLDSEAERTKTKESGWMICKYFSHSFQRVSIVFALTSSLSSWIIDISTMAF